MSVYKARGVYIPSLNFKNAPAIRWDERREKFKLFQRETHRNRQKLKKTFVFWLWILKLKEIYYKHFLCSSSGWCVLLSSLRFDIFFFVGFLEFIYRHDYREKEIGYGMVRERESWKNDLNWNGNQTKPNQKPLTWFVHGRFFGLGLTKSSILNPIYKIVSLRWNSL